MLKSKLSKSISDIVRSPLGWRLYYIKAYWTMRHVRRINELVAIGDIKKIDKYFQKISQKQKNIVFQSHYDTVAMLQNEEIIRVLVENGYDINAPILYIEQEGQQLQEHPINILALKAPQSSGGFDITPEERQIYISRIFNYYKNNIGQLYQFNKQLEKSNLDIEPNYIKEIEALLELSYINSFAPQITDSHIKKNVIKI